MASSSVMTWVYILRCSDDTLYVGHTYDLTLREKTHNEGRGGRYTALRRPVRLVYSEPHNSTEKIIARERQLKRWTRAKKEALLAGNRAALEHSSKSRQRHVSRVPPFGSER
jgi:predicted GIY-YIG superfamily endonuclease